METFVLWLGFIGAWLLFAGPIYQAALELQDEDIEVDRIRAAGAKIKLPQRSSKWWWLIPPFKLYLERDNRREYERRYAQVLNAEDLEAMVSYRSKASAWLFVATGGFCIACKETYELAHHENWSNVVLCFLVLGMFVLSILNLVSRLKKAATITKK